jgi:hypothetical protein
VTPALETGGAVEVDGCNVGADGGVLLTAPPSRIFLQLAAMHLSLYC